jgi:regulator of replication initiation timing
MGEVKELKTKNQEIVNQPNENEAFYNAFMSIRNQSEQFVQKMNELKSSVTQITEEMKQLELSLSANQGKLEMLMALKGKEINQIAQEKEKQTEA